MIDEVKLLMGIINDEYNGHSYNGASMVTTMQNLSLEQRKSTETLEGYSPWSVFLHNAYHKWKLIQFIDPSNPLDFPFEKCTFPPVPGEGTEKDWETSLKVSDELHRGYINLLEKLEKEKLKEVIAEWKCTIGQAVAWSCTHDSYHTAQIRNMGLPGL